MTETADTNAAMWKSEKAVQTWAAKAAKREAQRAQHWRFMGQLLPYKDEDRFTFLDLGAGTGAAARTILGMYPRARAILADFSQEMMGEGMRVMKPFEGRYRYVEFDMLCSDWPAEIPSDLDAVVTSMCVHHIQDERKQTLFRELFEHLRPTAWYVNYDPVASEDPLIEATWEQVNDQIDPDAAYKREHRTPEEQARHENHVRYMISQERLIGFLRAAGFVAVDVYWKQLDDVIFAGYRPE